MNYRISVAILLATAAIPAQTTRPTESLRILSVQCGAGPIWPHRIRALDERGEPTARILDVTDRSVVEAHRTESNPILPVTPFAAEPVLPDGRPGNQYLWFRFDRPVDAERLLRSGGLSVHAYDPETETSAEVAGRWFVGGMTGDREEPGTPRRVVEARGEDLAVVAPEGDGFPAGFSGAADLARPESVVFVPDADGDLTTFEGFPPRRVIQMFVTDEVRGAGGAELEVEIMAMTRRRDR